VGEVERGQYGDELQPDEWGAGYKARDDGCGAVGAVSVRLFSCPLIRVWVWGIL
jgi:hypothetical protein